MAKRKKIDWLNHFLEFIVVVIGILLAFQLNTCSENRQESELVDSHIKNIIEETKFNQNRVQRIEENSNDLIAMLDTLSLAIGNEDRLAQEHWLTLRLLSLDYLYIKKNAYNTLVKTGDIRFIDDLKLQNEIVSLYEYYGYAEGYEQMSRNVYTEYYYPYVMENFDLDSAKLQPIKVYNNRQFKNILASYKYSIAGRLERQKQLKKVISDFLKQYENY